MLPGMTTPTPVQQAEALWVRAHEHVRRGDFAPAVRDLAACFKLLQTAGDPRLPEVHRRWTEVHKLAVEEAAQGRTAPATPAVTAAPSLEAEAEAAANAGNLEEAISLYERALHNRPDNELVRERLMELRNARPRAAELGVVSPTSPTSQAEPTSPTPDARAEPTQATQAAITGEAIAAAIDIDFDIDSAPMRPAPGPQAGDGPGLAGETQLEEDIHAAATLVPAPSRAAEDTTPPAAVVDEASLADVGAAAQGAHSAVEAVEVVEVVDGGTVEAPAVASSAANPYAEAESGWGDAPVESVAVESVAVESVAVESVAVESVAVESVAVESVAALDTIIVDTAALESAPLATIIVDTAALEASSDDVAALDTITVDTAALESAPLATIIVDTAALEAHDGDADQAESSTTNPYHEAETGWGDTSGEIGLPLEAQPHAQGPGGLSASTAPPMAADDAPVGMRSIEVAIDTGGVVTTAEANELPIAEDVVVVDDDMSVEPIVSTLPMAGEAVMADHMPVDTVDDTVDDPVALLETLLQRVRQNRRAA